MRFVAVWLLILLLVAGTTATAAAQEIDDYLPPFAAGVNVEPGVTVLSRLRPSYDPLGVRLGSFMLTPSLTETTGFDSNVTGYSGGRGSAFAHTLGTASLLSQWSRDSLGASVTVDNTEYYAQPDQSFTNWAITVGGTHILGDGEATLAYSHLDLHETASDFGALQADVPVNYRVDDLRTFYAMPLGRMTLTPELDVQHYSYDNAIVLGVPVSLRDQTRDVITAGATLRYPLTDQQSLVLVTEAIDNNYEFTAAGQPTATSHNGRVLAGVDDAARGPWHYRLLFGAEVRSFAAPQYGTRVAPVLEGTVVWTPNGQTTATLSAVRTIEDPADNGVQGYVLSKARLVLDRELRRNLLAQASVGYQDAEPIQAGTNQTNLLFGASLTRFLNRWARLVLSYSFNAQRGGNVVVSAGEGAPSAVRGGNFNTQIIGLSLRLAM
jgi:hypothetical protein